MENTLDSNRLTRKEEAEIIARTLIEKFPNKLISKGGVKKMFNLPHVRASEINKWLEQDLGFKIEGRNFRIPQAIVSS